MSVLTGFLEPGCPPREATLPRPTRLTWHPGRTGLGAGRLQNHVESEPESANKWTGPNGAYLSTVFDPLSSGSAGASPSQPIHDELVVLEREGEGAQATRSCGFPPEPRSKESLK